MTLPCSLMLLCRAGFEKDLAGELQRLSRERGQVGFAKAKPDAGFVVWQSPDPAVLAREHTLWSLEEVVFARQMSLTFVEVKGLEDGKRLEPLLEAVEKAPWDWLGAGENPCVGRVILETPDTNATREILPFFSKFQAPFERALKKTGRFQPDKSPVSLHVTFLDWQTAFVGFGFPHLSSPHPMGILRLKFPSEAPSRSTLKLEEAFHVLLGEKVQEAVKPGQTAVDLGACPGGWTWQFTSRGVYVHAIDNGPMDPKLMAGGLVSHQRVDGFRYRPLKPVDWLVCDMVEQPSRIAALMTEWLLEGHARRAIFNLKLPMNARCEEVYKLLGRMAAELEPKSRALVMRAKQLYHDREEVTVYVSMT